MRDDSWGMEQRQLKTGKIRTERILNPLKNSGTKNQKAANDQQPISCQNLAAVPAHDTRHLAIFTPVSAQAAKRLVTFMCYV